ncbi:MAG: hypothetical protein KJO51_05075 [Gramella sp.]|nr:hypothetical protein [Christiangramia sp.]
MSNSRRKHPIFPNCQAASEKKEKLRANRKLRRLVSEKLKSGETGIPNPKEISDSW